MQVLNKVTSHHHVLLRSNAFVSASNTFLSFFFSGLTSFSFDAPAAGFPLGATTATCRVIFPSSSSQQEQLLGEEGLGGGGGVGL